MIKITKSEYNEIVTNADNKATNKYLSGGGWFVYEFADNSRIAIHGNEIVIEPSHFLTRSVFMIAE